MYKIVNPFINLANASLAALSNFMLTSEDSLEQKTAALWQASLENQARFVNEYTKELLATLAQSRQLMTGHMETLHQRTEHVATQLAHSTVRAVAIATQARREKRDRRVFPLPLPGERRTTGQEGDRRLPLIANQAKLWAPDTSLRL